jgi:hypothetical protein
MGSVVNHWKKNQKKINSERVIDCYLMPSGQFFSYIMTRTSYISIK